MPIVALLTDFGTRDHYVAAMKGVVLSVCPEAALVDITHDIPPQDVVAAALELAACYEYFPRATVFLAVVDPGVGSARRALAAEAGGYFFVGPDNGILTEVFRRSAPRLVVELSERRFARPTISRTFEGRDRFAPAAGWLARGVELERFGPPVPELVQLPLSVPLVTTEYIEGHVVRVDRFGNLITDIEGGMLDRLGDPLVVDAGGARVRLVETYADVAPGELCALIGSSGHVEVAINGGSAVATLTLARGDRVTVRRAG